MPEQVTNQALTSTSPTGAGGANYSPDDHLNRLLPQELQNRKLWFFSLASNIAEALNPPKLPPLQVTSQPVPVDEALKNITSAECNLTLWSSLWRNLKNTIAPPKEAPLQITSQPVPLAEAMKNITTADLEMNVFSSMFRHLREAINPAKLPPLELTSKPVPVKQMWHRSGNEWKSALASLAIQVFVVGSAFWVTGMRPEAPKTEQTLISIELPNEPLLLPPMPQRQQEMGGGGGGGDGSLTLPAKGRLPKRATRQFTPPMQVIKNDDPKLVMEPTIVMQEDVPIPQVNIAQYGDPFSKVIGPPSNGPGSGGGIGTGSGGGIGSGKGSGLGPGEGGGFGGGLHRIGGGVSAPVLIFKVEPEYSEEARKAKFQGTVRLAIVVDEAGRTADVKILRPLGLGLDEKAIEAVKKWRFRPAMKNNKAVAVAANVEVNFRLL